MKKIPKILAAFIVAALLLVSSAALAGSQKGKYSAHHAQERTAASKGKESTQHRCHKKHPALKSQGQRRAANDWSTLNK